MNTTPSYDTYQLHKCKSILKHGYKAFLNKKRFLSLEVQEQIESTLFQLQEKILLKETKLATPFAKQTELLLETSLKKSPFKKFKDGTITLVLALCAAVVIRQSVFELYEIPTGSMRPTLKEKDRLFVSKTSFGINIPLTTSHLLFNPSLVKRNGIFTFTGQDMDIRDVDTTYFYFFPGKKQYIKRLMGKPGDTLYFYGGQIYGIDENGFDITEILQDPQLAKIEHIPFIYFEGKVQTTMKPASGIFSPVTLYQMNEAVARMYLNNQNQVIGEMLSICPSTSTCEAPLKEYFDLWGFKNFGTTRILSKDQAKLLSEEDFSDLPASQYYLEIKHHPSLGSAKLSRDERGRLRPILGLSSSLIPLDEKHMQTLFNNLYTARFIVKNGFAYRFGSSYQQGGKSSFCPRLSGVPDGTYEFYYGKAYEVLWQGITKELPSTHPLYRFSPEITQTLYNLGIEFDTRFSPMTRLSPMPSRYCYFKEGSLNLMGAAIFLKEDPDLLQFIDHEKKKQSLSNSQHPYYPFVDMGPPLLDNGSLDKEFVKKYGITLPPKMYLALGDNHAMSADSRDFGFVPEDNIRGAPDFIFWPYGNRWGAPNQISYPWMTLPRAVIWSVVALGSLTYYMYHRRRNKLPFPLKEKKKS